MEDIEFVNKYKGLVYEPSDDTFLFVDVMNEELEEIIRKQPSIVLEIGCGSGYISTDLSCKLKKYNFTPFIITVDINIYANINTLELASVNNTSFIDTICMDMFNSNFVKNNFDLILFNPPYVPSDQDIKTTHYIDRAWNGGKDGNEIICKFINTVGDYLAVNGVVYLLVERRNKVETVKNMIIGNGFFIEVLKTRKVIGEVLTIIKFHK